MRQHPSYLAFIVLLASVSVGCAHQAVGHDASHRHEMECRSTNSAPLRTSPDEARYCAQQEYEQYDNTVGLFGYIVFRIVIESFVHAIIYR